MRLAGRGGPAPQCVGERQHELWRARAGEAGPRTQCQPRTKTQTRRAKRLKSPGIMSMREKRDDALARDLGVPRDTGFADRIANLIAAGLRGAGAGRLMVHEGWGRYCTAVRDGTGAVLGWGLGVG